MIIAVVVLACAGVGVAASGFGLSSLTVRSATRARSAPQVGAANRAPEAAARAATTQAPSLPPLPVKPTEININHSGWFSWALQDTRTGEIFGPADRTGLSTTASLIKAWIGADFLRRAAQRGQAPSDEDMEQLDSMIRDSDNEAASALHDANGGEESIRRLIATCGLREARLADDGGWSRTLLSPADITRLGACIADGRAAGPTWTDFLLDELRAVRDSGDFGIRQAFPEDQRHAIAVKNGWVEREEEHEFHVSCMAIGDGWVIGVMARYEIDKGVEYGAAICEYVGKRLREG
ncbi:hypothetical protein O7635_07150 [Asanoa sp. WMMD1127]|uniref:serine hydrolase n=1 Tax=Asanoa sp. WMMD1127 TaxID=3016107 RepID=UPI0024172A34|nr:serine hydrolase [Asanoa sp. WMMD1127]MDG4821629.1 hypothetical protein [Asanoa sp. WMMD1127]